MVAKAKSGKRFLYLLVLLAATSCTFSADLAQLQAVGSPTQVTCYSGGQVIYVGRSSGKVATEEKSDGWYFEEAKTGNLIRVSGTCIIRN